MISQNWAWVMYCSNVSMMRCSTARLRSNGVGMGLISEFGKVDDCHWLAEVVGFEPGFEVIE